MLNLSHTSIESRVDKSEYSIFQKLEQRSISPVLVRLLIGLSILAIGALFLPWTQNIRSKGFVSSLNPYDKPQSIQSLIDGRIEKWYVQEGDYVDVGDTILHITESKEEYLDPEILARTQSQINAKAQSADAYGQKAQRLESQYEATIQNRAVKLQQNELKIEQIRIKLQGDSVALDAAKIKLLNATNQLQRTRELYDKGIKSLTDLETKNFGYQEAQSKVTKIQNSLDAAQNQIANLLANRSAINNEYAEKLAKIQADIMASLSQQYSAEGDVNKLQSRYNNYKVRSGAYFIQSPIKGIITKAVKEGIGEFIKAGEDIITIIPQEFEIAVEMYVKPMDLPLLERGQKVRLQFDGWPAVVFSGWPDNSFGTFGGKIFAIDNFISENGNYRILVTPDPIEQPWPKEVRVGGGANGLILLKDVRLYYEVWRQLNGFPPDYYQEEAKKEKKLKAPIKKIK